jgi:hypothetical protein
MGDANTVHTVDSHETVQCVLLRFVLWAMSVRACQSGGREMGAGRLGP